MPLEHNVSLKSYNTFGIEVTAANLLRVDSPRVLQQQLDHLPKPWMILGGGSNVLFTDNFPGTIIKNEIGGREVLREDQNHVWVKLGAGENWHQAVLWAIENSWGGIENLSLIPGTVGAAPMQNIGAYGVELSSSFESLEALNLESGSLRTFNASQCQFGYRYSIFKGALKGQFMILSVILRLSKEPRFNTTYGALKDTLADMGVQEPTLKAVSDAVIKIRQSKLPDPQIIGNAGSFFKNPSIPSSQFQKLKQANPDLPGYPINEDSVKVPAGWLIERCNWKGIRQGAIGVHDQQALVLVNHGGGNGKDLRRLARDIQASVKDTFGIELSPEVNII